jgi:hypothetical protein
MSHHGLRRYINGMYRFFAEVQSVSTLRLKFDSEIPTICLERVRINKSTTVTDHAWIKPVSMDQGEPFPLYLNTGDTIAFVACVDTYYKGKGGGRKSKDYALARIKSIELIKKVSDEL